MDSPDFDGSPGTAGGSPDPIDGDYKMHDTMGLYLLVKKWRQVVAH